MRSDSGVSLYVDREPFGAHYSLSTHVAQHRSFTPRCRLVSLQAVRLVHILVGLQVNAQEMEPREPSSALVALEMSLSVASAVERRRRRLVGGDVVSADVLQHVTAPEEFGTALWTRVSQSLLVLGQRNFAGG